MKNYLLFILSIFITSHLWADNVLHTTTNTVPNQTLTAIENQLTQKDASNLNVGRKNRKSSYKRSKSSKYSFQVENVKEKRFQIRLKRKKARYRLSE